MGEPSLPAKTTKTHARGLRPSRSMAVLPRRSSSNNFVYCFFEYFHPLYPVLYRPGFQRQYEQLWISSASDEHQLEATEQDEAAFAASLNLVFAIGSRISPEVHSEEKRSVPEDFYRRARELYAYDLLTASSLPALQMLLLMSLYLQGTTHPAECWNSLGLAIRVAQSLGLHLDHGKDDPCSQQDANLRRQIWHLCTQLDG